MVGVTTVPTQVLLTAGDVLLREGLDGMLDRSGFSTKLDLLLQLADSCAFPLLLRRNGRWLR